MPEHMRMKVADTGLVADSFDDGGIAVRAERPTMIVGDHEIVSCQRPERIWVLAPLFFDGGLPAGSHQLSLAFPEIIVFLHGFHEFGCHINVPVIGFFGGRQLIAICIKDQKRFVNINMDRTLFEIQVLPCQASQFSAPHTGIEESQNDI